MNLKSLSIAVSAVLVLLCCVSRAQPQNLTELIKEIQSNFEKTLDPCHDFYEFACGGFIKTHPIPKNTSEEYIDWPVFQAVVNDTVRTIKKAVSQPWPVLNDFYRSCDRSQSEIDRSAEETYHAWTRYINSTSLSTSAEIWDVLAKLVAFRPFFGVSSETDSTNGNVTYRGPSLSPEGVYLRDSRDWNNATKVAEFLMFAETAFSNDTKLVAAKKAQTVVDVARYISNFTDDFGPSVKLTIANASRLTDIDWEAYFRAIGVKLNSSDYIELDELYFKNFTKYVTGLPEQTLRNYLQFVVFYEISQLNETLTCYVGEGDCDGSFNLAGFPYLNRSDKCALLTGLFLSDLVNFVITEETDAQSISAVERVANGLKEATNASLASLKWISSARDLKAATGKIQNVITQTGTEKTSRYSGVETQPDNIFDNFFGIAERMAGEQIRESYRVPNRTDFYTFPSFDVVNQYESNLIYIPATLINSEVFLSSWPKLFQFAKLGALIGRQFVHAIDEQGQYFDSVGNFAELFSLNTTQNYRTATQCVASAYNNYTLGNTTFNSGASLNEDIADIGGLKYAFNAYHAYIARYGKEFPDGGVIPGFSTDQVFFLISAQMSCSVQNDEYTKYQIEHSRVAPNKIRTNGAVSQSTEFAKAYNCPVGSPMNPARKCYIF